jgi:hypothetical protein
VAQYVAISKPIRRQRKTLFVKELLGEIKRRIHCFSRRLKFRDKPKIFCIGLNKTGTTSLKSYFEEMGFEIGNQTTAEWLLKDIAKGNFDGLFAYCDTAEFFQDFPFSTPGIYKILEKRYPDAKFILTVRDSPEIWYSSLVNFHTARFGNGGLPKEDELKSSCYVYKGWIWDFLAFTYGFEKGEELYDKKSLTNIYLEHINAVKSYFCKKPDNLLIVNLSNKEDFIAFESFLGLKSSRAGFPWKNKLKETSI